MIKNLSGLLSMTENNNFNKFTLNEATGEVIFNSKIIFDILEEKKALKEWEDILERKIHNVTLISKEDNKRIPAHKSLLSACSAYFECMFHSGMKESHEDEVTFGEMAGEVIEIIVNFCYTSHAMIKEHLIFELHSAAKVMLFDDLLRACEDYLWNILSPNNCIMTLNYAPLLHCKSIQSKALRIAKDSFNIHLDSEELLYLNFHQLFVILNNDTLNVNNEMDVLRAIIKWVHFDYPVRICDMPKLIGTLRIERFEEHWLKRYLTKAFKDKAHYMPYLVDYVNEQIINVNRPVTSRNGFGVLLVNSSKISVYHPLTNEVQDLIIMMSPLAASMVTLVGQKLFFFGSHTSLIMFDFETKAFTTLPGNKHYRKNCAIVHLNDEIYLIGGGSEIASPTVEKYNIKTNTWSDLPPMIHGRYNHFCGVLNGKIYVIGGRNRKNKVVRTVEYFDPEENEWDISAKLTTRLENSVAVTYEDYMYVLGGIMSQPKTGETSKSNIGYRFSERTDYWYRVNIGNLNRVNPYAFVFDSKIFAFESGVDTMQICDVDSLSTTQTKSTTIGKEWQYYFPISLKHLPADPIVYRRPKPK